MIPEPNCFTRKCKHFIGVKNDGLLHRSQIPAEVALRVGDVIEVEILKVDEDRGRISLGWAAPREV